MKYSPKTCTRVADRVIRAVDKERDTTGTNGIGKPFALREKPDWRVLLAFQFGRNGKRIHA